MELPWTPQPIEYDDAAHTYALNGKPAVSITTILKATYGKGMYDNVLPSVLQKAADRGSRIDAAIGALRGFGTIPEGIRGEELTVSEAGKKVLDKTGWVPVGCQIQLVHPELWIAGTMDELDWMIEGERLVVVDYKATYKHDELHEVQTVFYAWAVSALTGLPCEARVFRVHPRLKRPKMKSWPKERTEKHRQKILNAREKYMEVYG